MLVFISKKGKNASGLLFSLVELWGKKKKPIQNRRNVFML